MPDASSSSLSASRSGIAGLRRRLRPRPQGVITALDVDGQTLWVAQATARGITRVDSAPLSLAAEGDRTDPGALGQAIANALRTLQLKPGAVVMGVPRAQIVLRTLNLPVVADIRELASMVHLQIGKDLPFRPEDAVIDFKVHRQLNPSNPSAPADAPKPDAPGGPAAPRLEILVAVVHRDVVAFCEQTAEAAGLKLAALGLRAYANARCLQACEKTDSEQAVALVSLRPDEVNIDVIIGEALLFSRGVAVPAPTTASETAASESPAPEDSDESPVSVANFVEAATIEVVRTLHGYGGMAARSPVAKVVVTGAPDQEEAVVQALSRRLSVPCSLFPMKAFSLENQPIERARGAVSAIGLALGFTDSAGLPFDFLDPKRPAVQRDMGRIRVLAGIAALAALFLVLLVVRSQLVQRREALKRAIYLEVTEAEKKNPIYKAMHQQALAVDGWTKEDRNWLDHYAYLSAILPPSEEVYITSFSTTPQGVIRLGVQSRRGEILSRIDKQLRAAGYEIPPLAITPGADRHGYDFSSTVELIVPDKMTIDLAKVRPPVRPPDDASLDPGALKGGRP